MALDLKNLDVLKEKMVTVKEFKEAWEYFFDNFADEDRFLDIGKRVKYPDLAKVLETVGQQLLGKPDAKATNFLLIGLVKYNFYHGTFFIDNKLASFIFFKDIDTGMVAVSPAFRSKETLLSRFSLTQIKSGLSIFSPVSLN